MISGIVAGAILAAGGGPAAPLWEPTDLGADLEAWYDADQQVESDGANVTTFVDRSGNGFDFTTGSAGPVLRYNRVNGLKALEVTDDTLSCGTSLLSGVTSCAAFYTAKGLADPSVAYDRAPLNNFGTDGASHYYVDGIWYETFGTNARRTVNPPTDWDEWRVTAITSAPSDYRLWWDATAIYTSASNTVSLSGSNRVLFALFGGDFQELILTNVVPSSTRRQRIEGYLAHRIGTQANLPVDHPFKDDAPTKAPMVSYADALVSTEGSATIEPDYDVIATGTPTFSLYAGSLPPGMSLDSSTGEISGTASSAGTYSGIQIELSDGTYSMVSEPFALTAGTGLFDEFELRFFGSNSGAGDVLVRELTMANTHGGPDITFGRPTSGSGGVYSGNEGPDKAINNNTGDWWQPRCSPAASGQVTFGITFASLEEITEITLDPHPSFLDRTPKAMDVYGRVGSGGSWVLVQSFSGWTSWSGLRTLNW